MNDFLGILSIPDTARIVDHLEGDWLAWDAFLELSDGVCADAPEPRTASPAYGVQAANGLDTLALVCGLLRRGIRPSLFPEAVSDEARDACLATEGAERLFRRDAGWSRLAAPRPQAEGYELVMHSSGSTGVPKSLGIRLEAMRTNALDVARDLALGPDDVHMGVMSHCYMSGLYNSFLLPMATGGGAVVMPLVTPLSLKVLLAAIRRYAPTVLWLSPLMARLLVRSGAVTGDVLGGLRFVLSCTAPLAPGDKEAFEDKFRIPLLQSYGLCETLITTMEAPRTGGPTGSAGLPVGGADKVFLDGGGEICVRNGALMAGYIGSRGLEPLAGDVFETGDTGHFDGDGNLHVTGRLNEVINRNGIKFTPGEVEDAVLAVEGVEECVVVGGREASSGDVKVVAWVVGTVSAAVVLGQLGGKLDPVMIPHAVRFLTELPRTGSGKIDRAALKKEADSLCS